MSTFSGRRSASLRASKQQKHKLNGSPRRFSPRLELLEDRTVPASIFQVTSPNAAGLASTIASFKAELGGATITASNQPSNATGSREITWEDVGGNPANFTGDYFNTTVRRGIIFTVNGSTNSSSFDVSSDGFAEIDPSYPATFQAFSPPRMFAPRGTNITDVNFRDPNSPATEATVKGFGIVFCDVDLPNFTSLTFYDSNNNVLLGGPVFAPVQDGGFSFVGAILTDGTRIDHVEITTGTSALAPGITEGDPTVDVVAMDNVIYGQPQQVATQIYRWLDVNGNWNDSTNWQQTSGNIDPNPNNRFPNGPGAIAVFDSNLTMPHTIALPDAGNTTVGAIQIDTSQNLDFTTNTGNLIFQAAGNTSADAALDVTDLNGHGTVTFDTPVQLNRNWEVSTVNASSIVQLNGVVSDTSSRSITKRGSGTLDFAGGVTDSFNGPVNVQGGTAQVDAVFSNSSIALAGGTLSGSGTVNGVSVQNTGNTVAPGTALTTGTLTSSQSVTWDGNTTFFVKLRSGGNDEFLTSGNGSAGNINLGGAQLQLDLSGFVPAVNTAFAIVQASGTRSGQFAQGSFIVVDNQLFRLDYTSHSVTATKVSTATTVDLTRAPNQDTVFGQQVTFTATVNTQADVATGQIHFQVMQGAMIVTQADVPLNVSGSASLPVSNLNQGDYTVTAAYVPSGIFDASQAAPLDHMVNATDVTTTVSTTASTAIYSTPTITAHVQAASPGAGIPMSGTVLFIDTSNNNAVLGTAAINASGNATLGTVLDVGNYTIAAEFQSTDTNFNDGALADSNAISQHITAANSQVNLVSNPGTWTFNQDIQFTATVSSSQASGQTPTGSIQFRLLPNTDLGAPVPLLNGSASTTVQLPPGSQSVRAIYIPANPPADFTTSSATLTQTVNQAQVNIAITPQPATIVFGQTYSVLATVSPAGVGPTPTGNVTFTLASGDNNFSTGNIALVNGQATMTSDLLPSLPVGIYDISVSYQGSPPYQSKTTVLQNGLTESKADVTVSLGSVSAITGQTVQMTAVITVNSPGNGTPNGNVHFVLTSGAIVIAQDVPVQQNGATFSSNTLLPGNYTVTAQYQDSTGSFNNNTSGPATASISQANVNFQLDNNLISRFGDAVTYTTHVSSVIPGSPIPVGGNVHFQIFPVVGGVPQPAVVDVNSPVQNGIATLSQPINLPVGQYQVQANYLGDVAYLPAGPLTIQHTINTALTTVNAVLLAPVPGTPIFGQQLTFQATVSANNGNAGTPNGTVTFVLVLPDGTPSITSGPITLNANGQANFSPTQVLPPTEQRSPIQVHVTYNGDDSQGRFAMANNDASPLLQTVLRPSTATALTVARASDHATTGIRYAENVVLTATVTVTGLDPASTTRAGTPNGNVQFIYVKGSTEVPIGAPVTLNATGVATLSTLNGLPNGAPIRLPGGAQIFRAYYVDNRAYNIYNPSNTQSSTTIVPQPVTADTLSVRPATGSATPNNVYAYGRSLIFSVHYRFENNVLPGTLITGDPVQTFPTGTGQFRFTIGTTVFTTANINLVPPPAGTSPRTPTVQPFSTMTFTSSALFSTSIGNRTLGTNLALVLPSGNYHGEVFVNYTSSNGANFQSFDFNRVTFDTFFLTIQTASVGRRWTRP
jgi:hypothetical protein